MKSKVYILSPTTQGPTYPPSEIVNEQGDFVTVGRINRKIGSEITSEWGAAIVSKDSPIPNFGLQAEYNILSEIDIKDHRATDILLCGLPLPLPANNYPMTFAPEQEPSLQPQRKVTPLHLINPPDYRFNDGLKRIPPITLTQWLCAKGKLKVIISDCRKFGEFNFKFTGLIPNTIYTVMSLREGDLHPDFITRPGPLGIPNILLTDEKGNANYHAKLPNPFPEDPNEFHKRIINVVLLWMSSYSSHSGAIGIYGLGGDVHAQLKLKEKSFTEFNTIN